MCTHMSAGPSWHEVTLFSCAGGLSEYQHKVVLTREFIDTVCARWKESRVRGDRACEQTFFVFEYAVALLALRLSLQQD